MVTNRDQAEEALQRAHKALANAGKTDWDTAHKEYKKAFAEASRLRHLETMEALGLTVED